MSPEPGSSRRAKTDRIDAKLLAEMGAVLELPSWEPPSEHALALRTLTRRIRALVDDRTREKNRLQAARATQSTPRAVLDDLILHIAELDHRIDGLRRAAVALALEDPECAEHVRLLTTIQGIADATAVEILGELRCMPRDLTAKQAVAQAGLDPKANESGTKVGRRRISKMGSRRLRTALFIAATNVIKWSPAFRAHFDKLKESGKHTMVAKIAVARKLLHVCMGMLRTGTAFDSDLVRPRGSQSKQVA